MAPTETPRPRHRSPGRRDRAAPRRAHAQPLPLPAIEQLARGLEPVHVPAGQAVFRQGDPADRFYVIETGAADVVGDGRLITTLGPGDGFGEIGLLRTVPRTATVRATSDLELQALTCDPLPAGRHGIPAERAGGGGRGRGDARSVQPRWFYRRLKRSATLARNPLGAGRDCRNLLSALLHARTLLLPRGKGCLMTPKQSLLQRCLAVLSATLLAGALVMLSTWVPAGATGAPGERGDRDDADALQIVLIKDRGSGLPWPVQDRKFNVVVQAVDDDGEPTEVHEPTKIKLMEVSGPGRLGGNTTAVIQKDFSSTTIKGATYSQFANGVVLNVKVVYGEDLAPDEITVEVALTAVGANAKPGKPLKLKDPNCAAPTSKVPTCGILVLKNGADGHVTLVGRLL